jgi:hypothetical protein
MYAIVSLLIVVALSILITRIATVALTHTGLSRQVAQFQARSALTGAGFTTAETEQVVNHPVRRRIVRILMLVGNAGIITAVSSLILGFVSDTGDSRIAKFLALGGGLILLWVASRSQTLDRLLHRAMTRMLEQYTDLDTRDFVGLLHLAGDYTISELTCRPGDWMEDRTLKELRLREEGLMVLGINRRSGQYIGAPTGDTRIRENDQLLLYGTTDQIHDLDLRAAGPSGDIRHHRAVAEQRSREAADKERDLEAHGNDAEDASPDASHPNPPR